MLKLARINLSCNNFTTFPAEAMFSNKLVEVDLSSNKVCYCLHTSSMYACMRGMVWYVCVFVQHWYSGLQVSQLELRLKWLVSITE